MSRYHVDALPRRRSQRICDRARKTHWRDLTSPLGSDRTKVLDIAAMFTGVKIKASHERPGIWKMGKAVPLCASLLQARRDHQSSIWLGHLWT